ncbi:zinc finger protein CKR1 [Amyelois transitella]|uniref:zinc finger protein CKR1 n=1 Tax=Amyelois transitella TaxID=680683 RepID=UPI0029906C1B|nr:zinc finger protein CKR1 [Amyelois transitella]
MRTYSRKKVDYQVIEGVEDLCRLCLEKCDGVIPIFTDSSDVRAPLPMRIMICVGLEMVREDCLPNMICQTCYAELNRCYTFRKKCEATYQKLKAHVLAVKALEFKKQEEKKNFEQQKQEFLGNEKEMRLQNGSVEGKLVLSLTENNQLELVDDGLNGVLHAPERQDDLHKQFLESSREMLSQNSDRNDQTQDILTGQNQETNHSDMSLMLSGILIRLGILNQKGELLEVVEQGFPDLELEAENGEKVTLELIEEDDSDPTHNQLETTSTQVVEVTKTRHPKDFELELKMASQSQSKRSPTKNKCDKSEVAKERGAWCATCDKWLSSRSALARHARAHSAARPHACEQCGRAFAQRCVLARHRLVHSAVRPFPCGACARSFTQRAALAAHARSHAPAAARTLRLHRCGSCPKVFLYASGLSRHLAVHEGRVYTCDLCSRDFTDKSALTRHLKSADHRGKDK